MKDNHLLPIIHFTEQVMVKGDGSYVYDDEGKKYLDLNSGQFCTALGHSNKYVLDSVFSKGSAIVHTASNIVTDEVIKCSNELNKISGDMNASCILLSTGSEAVEFCMRYAKHIKDREGIVCFDKGYHGLTLGSQSITFSGKFARPIVKDVAEIGIPENDDDVEKVILKLKEILMNGSYAAVLIEPIVSVGGMIYPPKRWFKELRKVCDDFDVLLIFDESQTGFGRTGEWFAYQTFEVVPDMVILSKSAGLGFPVSVALFRDKLIPENGECYAMTHYSSHQNDGFAASIINTGIEYIKTNNVLDEVKKRGQYFLEKLIDLESTNPHIQSARGKGLMLGCELYYPGVDNYRSIYDSLYKTAMEKGVIIQGTNGGHTLRFLPDYLIAYDDIDFALEKISESLLELEV